MSSTKDRNAKISIKDIADMSGVGISTVSRVINNSGYVSESTRAKVTAVIDSHNYRPNSIRSHISTIDSPSIAVMVKGIGNPFFQKMTRELERSLSMRGYSTTFHDVLHLDEMVYTDIEIKEHDAKGVIIMGGSNTYSQAEIEQLEAPAVFLTVSAHSDVPSELYSSVTIDDEVEGYKATRALIEMGHRHIAFIYTDRHTSQTPNQKRYLGYLRAHQEAGLPVEPSLVAGAEESTINLSMEVNGYRLGFRMMQRLLNRNEKLTAVFAYSDMLAMGAAKAALMARKRISEDISIIGFDGIDEAEFYHPSIDTMYQPTTEMVNSAVSLLMEMIDGSPGQQIVLPCTLIRRGSTSPR